MRIVILTLLVLATVSCKTYTCSDIPDCFPSSDSAISYIQQSKFRYTDDLVIRDRITRIFDSSRYITSAAFYSCDKKTGYFLFSTSSDRIYEREGVPIGVWKRLKDTSDRGAFFERNIRGIYSGGIRCVEIIDSVNK